MHLTFLKSALNEEDWIHDTRKEIAFIGRSNVGKSSLINALFHTKIVKTSSTPGRTQMINFFETDGNFRIVDLPGYGYSKIQLKQIIKINQSVNQYLNFRKNLQLIILVLDINVITEKDVKMIQELQNMQKSFIIVLNKCDKLAKSYFHNHQKQIADYLQINETIRLVDVSAKTHYHLDILLAIIKQA